MNSPIYRCEYEAQQIVTSYPAQLHDRNKDIVFEMSMPRGAAHLGAISVARWKQLPLPKTFERSNVLPLFELRNEYFTYDPAPAGCVEWHLNFAHYDLFVVYGSQLFAQDEMQVAEHPALASLRHALIDSGYAPLTVENGVATPILIMGVERRCEVATDPNPNAGRPVGLYGNHFARASEDAIRRATRVFDPPTISNILAMEAPAYGAGQYEREQIEFVLSTAYTGFRAAVMESRRAVSPDVRTVIHTGYWGCGAYGGNRELMPLLQMIAACCAEVDTLVFHTGGDGDGFAQSTKRFAEFVPVDVTLQMAELLTRIERIGYTWGVSDGN